MDNSWSEKFCFATPETAGNRQMATAPRQNSPETQLPARPPASTGSTSPFAAAKDRKQSPERPAASENPAAPDASRSGTPAPASVPPGTTEVSTQNKDGPRSTSPS